MKPPRLALTILGAASALLGLAVVLFALGLEHPADIGSAYMAVLLFAAAGSVATVGLFVGSVLGTMALVRHPESRRPLFLLVMLAGWIAALSLGWIAWEFWLHSSRTPGVG
jgi:hypothetical protein